MGLFSRKKKTSAVAPGSDPAALTAGPSAPAVDAGDAEKDQKLGREERMLAEITAKRRNIKMMEVAVSNIESKYREATLAVSNAEKELEARSRDARRLKTCIEHYKKQILVEQQQLDNLEDESAFAHQHEANMAFKRDLEQYNINFEDVDDALRDMRAAIAASQNEKDASNC